MGRPKGVKNKPKENQTILPLGNESNINLASKKIKKDKVEVSKLPKITEEQKKLIKDQKKAAQREKKLANLHYDYTPLAETSLGATDLYNLYGVVIDAVTPRRKDQNSKKFFQQIKIIDISMHFKNRHGENEYNRYQQK